MRTSLINLALLCSGAAQAADRVIHDGEPEAVRALVSERAGVDVGSLTVERLDQLLVNTSRPTLGPAGALQRCQGVALSLDAFDEALSAAEGDVLYMDFYEDGCQGRTYP